MPTAYLFNMPYHGHVNPCLSLIQELVRLGDRVVLYGTEQFRRAAESAGAQFRLFDHDEIHQNISLATMAEWQMQVIESSMDELIADARKDMPDYVIVDYTCLWGRVFAQHLGLPAVVIHHSYPFLPSRLYPPFHTVKEWHRRPALWRTQLSFVRADRRISRKYGTPRIGLPFDLIYANYGALQLVLTNRDMTPNGSQFPGRYVFVGPCVRASGHVPTAALPELDGRPLLYISLGTHWKHSSDIYRACIEGLANAPIQVLIAGAHRLAPELLARMPANFHVRDHVDQIEVLKRAAAFLTHGGMNSVCEAFVAGVPMLVYPLGFDQHTQARYVERSGAGFRLTPEELTAENIRSRVDQLLTDRRIRARCQEIGENLLNCGGAAKAADLITSVCGAGRRKPADAGVAAVRPAAAEPVA